MPCHCSHYCSNKAYWPKPIPDTDRQTGRQTRQLLQHLHFMFRISQFVLCSIFKYFVFFSHFMAALQENKSKFITLNAADSLSGTMRF